MTAEERRKHRDGARVRFPPPLVFLLSLLAGYLLQSFVGPISAPPPSLIAWLLPWISGTGALFTALGLLVAALALERFFRTRQNPEPWTPTPELVVGGIYRVTRNPMYLGMALVQAGLGMLSGILWMTLLTPLSMVAVYRIAIRPEEVYLADKFGASYERYRQRVRRWI